MTDEELLSIVIGEGSAAHSALETARRVVEACGGSLSGVAKADMVRLRMTEGIGIKRAAVLAAAFELAARLRRTEAAAPAVIRDNDDVTALFGPYMAGLQHEEMWALYLTSANGVIERTRVSQGGVTALVVDYKLIVKRAVELLASSLIIVHNHPSGVAVPSPEDIDVTDRIAAAAALFDIRLLDHIIVASGKSYSFRQQGLLK